MDIRLVQDVDQILLLLRNGRLHVNAIRKQTDIGKDRVFVANHFLEKAKLANKIRDKRIHKQKGFLQLNEFGQEIANFIENIVRFEGSLEGLKEILKRVYHVPENAEKSTIRSLLLHRGLNRQEIASYKDDLGYAEDFVRDSLSILSDGIVNKYASLILQFTPNIHAKKFLEELIIRQLSKFILLKIETTVEKESVKCEKCGMDLSKQLMVKHKIDEIVDENGSRLFTSLTDYMYSFNNRLIKDEVKAILSCLFSILHLPKKYVEQEVKRNIEEIEEIERDPSSRVSSRINEAGLKRNLDFEKKIYNYIAEINTLA